MGAGDPFLITGLPRSRTAWLAVACGCLHEPTAGDPDAAVALWERGERGISDSGLAPHLESLLERASPRVLAIRRPVDEVMRSMCAYVGAALPMDWSALRTKLVAADETLERQRFNPRVLNVPFDGLRDYDTTRRAILWLTGSVPAHLHQLMHMNVQSDLGYNLQRAEAA